MNKLPPAIESSGYGISGDIGGLPRQTYYTPDGRVIKAIPSIREYVIKAEDGKVIKSGTRDANYGKGWLPVMPSELKLYCAGCDMWHDTQGEVDTCIVEKNKQVDKLGKKAVKQNEDEIDALKKEVAELKEMVKKLTEVKNG